MKKQEEALAMKIVLARFGTGIVGMFIFFSLIAIAGSLIPNKGGVDFKTTAIATGIVLVLVPILFRLVKIGKICPPETQKGQGQKPTENENYIPEEPGLKEKLVCFFANIFSKA